MRRCNVQGLIENVMSSDIPAPEAIRAALQRIVTSPQLESSPSLCRFLRYVVEETLAGRGGMIKEYSLGAEVFTRGDDFDPRIDPIVRVQARTLRARMAKYYEGPGAGDPIIIDLPKRTYVPEFTTRELGVPLATPPIEIEAEPVPAEATAPIVNAPPVVGAPRQTRRTTARVVAAGILVALAGAALSWSVGQPHRQHDPDPIAQEQYIRGRFLMDRHNEKALRKSVASFERAIAKDAHFAAAYAGM